MNSDTGAGGGRIPAISVVVPTRNRGAAAADTVASLLASDHPDFDILVVDQSPGDETDRALQAFGHDPRFRYLRSDTVGAGRARNVGAKAVSSPYVAFTDDDCEVPTDWLSTIASLLDRNPAVSVLYTNVVAGPHDPEAGFVPAYVRDDDATVTTIIGKIRARGISAGVAARRDDFLAIGGFDDNMGPGARFPSAEDRDLAIRAILAGRTVYETAATEVIHHGFRDWEDGRALTRRDWVAMGAMCAKPLRTGHWLTIVYALYEFIGGAIIRPALPLLRGKRPRGFRRAGYFIKGFRDGWRWPIDEEFLVFLDEPAA